MSTGHQFVELDARESQNARAEVADFAVEQRDSNLRAWERSCGEADRLGKPRPQKPRAAFDLDWCRNKSAQIRTKRERDASYFNQLTSELPTT